MNEAQHDPPWYKRPDKVLLKYIREEIGIAIAGLILWKWGGQIWNWLLQSIQTYTAQIVCVVSSAATVAAVYAMFLWRRIARLETAKSSRASELEIQLNEALSKIPAPHAWKDRYEPLLIDDGQVIFKLKTEFERTEGKKFICPICWDGDKESRLINPHGRLVCQTHQSVISYEPPKPR